MLPPNPLMRPLVAGEDSPLPAEVKVGRSNSPRSRASSTSPRSPSDRGPGRTAAGGNSLLAVLKCRCRVRATPSKKALVVGMLPVGARVDVVAIAAGPRGR